MVGFYGGEPLEYAGITEQGSDAVPSTLGQQVGAAAGEAVAHNLLLRLGRSQARLAAETGVVGFADYAGEPIVVEPEPPIAPETANAEFGIKDHLSFDAPIARSIAKDLYEHHRARLLREDVIARGEGGMVSGISRFTTYLATSILDPVNAAAGFIPIIGPARATALVAQAGSTLARAGVRAEIGAGAGAVGAAAVQPLEFALSRQEREDYTMADALRNIALGTVLGGGLHAGVGAAVDRAAGRYDRLTGWPVNPVTGEVERPARFENPLTQRIEDAGPEAREALLRGALAQTIEGRAVNVAPVLDAVEAARAGDVPRLRAATEDLSAARRADLDVEPLQRQREDSARPPGETLEDIRAQIAELERMERASATPEPVDRAGEAPGTFHTAIERDGEQSVVEGPTDALRPSRADVLRPVDVIELGEARAAAIERAAFCLTRAG